MKNIILLYPISRIKLLISFINIPLCVCGKHKIFVCDQKIFFTSNRCKSLSKLFTIEFDLIHLPDLKETLRVMSVESEKTRTTRFSARQIDAEREHL